jgi:hypothetical protein
MPRSEIRDNANPRQRAKEFMLNSPVEKSSRGECGALHLASQWPASDERVDRRNLNRPQALLFRAPTAGVMDQVRCALSERLLTADDLATVKSAQCQTGAAQPRGDILGADAFRIAR